ncbi:MAG: D-alanine--D-alanine ligase [Pseudomonadota bacterium]|nr:D-alanine--D-alanine ligase [Pseudomonadota bacterium]
MNVSVAVLAGGWSSEREVSLMGSGNIAAVLREAGYDVREIDVRRNIPSILKALTPPPDVVYNALHGPYGEDGCIQGILECLGIRYTHSGVLASAMAMNKPMAKHLFQTAGIPCPQHRIVSRADFDAGKRMDLPYVMKPLNEGSSVGVRIIRTQQDVATLREHNWAHGSHMMLESLIDGREITVSVMGEKALGVTEIRPFGGFYDYEAKYTAGRTEHIIPAPIHAKAYEGAMDYAVRAHRALGCRGVSRADFMYDDRSGEPGDLYLLEVNTQPGMTPLSLVPEQAAHAGIEFSELVCWMVENASCDG